MIDNAILRHLHESNLIVFVNNWDSVSDWFEAIKNHFNYCPNFDCVVKLKFRELFVKVELAHKKEMCFRCGGNVIFNMECTNSDCKIPENEHTKVCRFCKLPIE